MPKFICIERVESAIINLCSWRGGVKQQSTAHVLPLLALLEKGAGNNQPIVFEEADDFAFFNRYFRVDLDPENPYFDPFSRELRISSHPHSNIATARKNTFQNRWKAASFKIEGEISYWQLNADFCSIFSSKLFTKGTERRRVNVVDLAVWLFKQEEFSESASASEIQNRFKERFPLRENDFDQLFEFQDEPSQNIFQSEPITNEQIAQLVSRVAYADAPELIIPVDPPAGGDSVGSESGLPQDDAILIEVKGIIGLGSSGIILKGAPGTGKSWYADQIAQSLTNNDRSKIFRIQFHPSFTYEDFFDGYLPSESSKSGFEITGKVFRRAVEAANATDKFVVLIIDEINRGNTAKIFGEALTYIEHGWRNVKFIPRLSKQEISIPSNLVILATMNPHDRSITPLDMALLRRFDHIELPPSEEMVADFLEKAGMPMAHSALICNWFGDLQRMLPFGIGHTFFINVSDIGRLGLVWRYRILPFCQSILEYEPQKIDGIRQSYDALERRLREVIN